MASAQQVAELHDEVDVWDRDRLIPYANNPKQHPSDQVDKIAASIKQYGWDQPIVADGDGEIIKGHGRYQAAKKLGMDEVPVIVRDDLSDAEKKAARIADNRTAQSEWADESLATELENLREMDIDPPDVGFDEGEMDDLLADDWDEDLDMEDFGDPLEDVDTTVTLTFDDEMAYEDALDWFDDMMAEHGLNDRAAVIEHLATGGPL